MAASGVEDGVGLVAVRELEIAQAPAGLNATVELARDGLDLVGGQVLAVTPANDLGERAGVLGQRRGRCRGGGCRGFGGIGWSRRGGGGRAALRESFGGQRERGRRESETHQL